MWICLPIYWGALAYPTQRTKNLAVWFVDRDDSQLGRSLWTAVSGPNNTGLPLGWQRLSEGDAVLSGEEGNAVVTGAVLNNEIWAAVVVASNATSRLAAARETGDSTFDPRGLVTMYYAQARQEIAIGTYLLPSLTSALSAATGAYATTSAQDYLMRVYAQGRPNTTALQMLARAPQTLVPGVAFSQINLRPLTAPVATAVILVGQIFLAIFTSIITMANATARAHIAPRLKFRSYTVLRLVVPTAAYVPLALTYSLVSLAFGLPFDAKYGQGVGFVLFWVYVWLGLCALGLALEAMVTVLTPRFLPFFLFLLIIVNLSAAALPDELQPSLYKYSVAFPMWNLCVSYGNVHLADSLTDVLSGIYFQFVCNPYDLVQRLLSTRYQRGGAHRVDDTLNVDDHRFLVAFPPARGRSRSRERTGCVGAECCARKWEDGYESVT
ncbi:hypothetical protein CONPUDRAFT_128595, partial [Coniophora puteana RWD-64-598 SS2]